MKYRWIILIFIVLCAGSAAFARQTGDVMERHEIEVTGPAMAPPPHHGPEDRFIFISSEFDMEKLVKGAPYSAEAVTERIQDLADGNRITQRNTATVYRDSEGRIRREQEIGSIGPWAASSKEPVRTIFIHDPVSGVDYVLNEKDKTAHKLKMPKDLKNKPAPRPMTDDEDEIWTAPAPAPGPGGPAFEKHVFRFYNEAKNAKKESLGKQMIDGISTEGTRTVSTIAQGQIGNERPIQIVSEKWYSPELQVYLMTKHSDPRFGESTYRLTNISRREPDSSLFRVPDDYKVTEMPGGPGKVFIQKEVVTKPKSESPQ